MLIKVNMKRLGKRKAEIEAAVYELENNSQTVKELIKEMVKCCVQSYNERKENSEILKYLTKEEITDQAAGGKVSFGVNYGIKNADYEEAVQNAQLSFEDGIYRIFVGEKELETLDEVLTLKENDLITFVRMTMLSGRMW